MRGIVVENLLRAKRGGPFIRGVPNAFRLRRLDFSDEERVMSPRGVRELSVGGED